MKNHSEILGLDGQPHFAVVAADQPSWPLALCGPVKGKLFRQSKAEADLFADAPTMLELLQALHRALDNINPAFPLGPGKLAQINELVARAGTLIQRHTTYPSPCPANSHLCHGRRVGDGGNPEQS